MKLNRTPLILLAIAALLGGFVYFYEIQGGPQRQEAQQKNKQVFSFKEEEVEKFSLKTQQQTLNFAKEAAQPTNANGKGDLKGDRKENAKGDSKKDAKSSAMIWRMMTPNQGAANEASIAYLLSLMSTAKSEKTLQEAKSKQAEFGLDQPLAIVEVTLKNQQVHRLVLGKPDFNRTYLYAQADPPEQPGTELSVLLLPMEFENAVKRPLAEWELKPAPQATPTSTKTPPGKTPSKSTETTEKGTKKPIEPSTQAPQSPSVKK